jgi:hypothetical protein
MLPQSDSLTILHLSLSLVLSSLSPIVVVSSSTSPTYFGVVHRVFVMLLQLPPLWHPLLGILFYPCHRLSEYR